MEEPVNPALPGKWLLNRVTACLENLEMSGIDQKPGNCRGKILSAKTFYC